MRRFKLPWHKQKEDTRDEDAFNEAMRLLKRRGRVDGDVVETGLSAEEEDEVFWGYDPKHLAETFTIPFATDPDFGAQLGPSVHRKIVCAGEFCVIHNPSDHHMRDWPLNWRDDRKIMERLCPHGVGHPDPDDAAYLVRVGRLDEGVHGCDGCCSPPERS